MNTTLKNGKNFFFPRDVNLNQSGIYRVIFNTGHFYIGSTQNFKSRMALFKTQFVGKAKIDNKKLSICMKDSHTVSFEIIQIVSNKEQLGDIETEKIKPFIGNPLLINRAFNGNSSKGIKWTEEEKAKTSATMKEKYKSGILKPNAWKFRKKMGKPVIMYDQNGKKIKKFKSLMQAASFIKSNPSSISNQIKGVNKIRKHHKGFMFKYA